MAQKKDPEASPYKGVMTVKRLSGNRTKRLDEQIKRAAALAAVSEKEVAALYLIHKELCEQTLALTARRLTRTRPAKVGP